MHNVDEMKLYELYYIVYVYSIYEDDDIVPYDMEYVWHKINDYYYQENDILLDINKEDDRSILFNWMKEKCRYQLLDELMVHMFNRFINIEDNGVDNRDEFFINNIDMMEKIMGTGNYDMKMDDKNISELSKDKVITLVKEILLEIDPSSEWLRIYEEAIDKNKIIYLNELDKKGIIDLKKELVVDSLKYIDNSCLTLKNGEKYIFLNYKGDISDISTTIHEFTHYVSKYNHNEKESPILREFPAIFFELYALEYLKEIGYDETDIILVNQHRIADTYMAIMESRLFIYYLKTIMNNGVINEEIDRELIRDKYYLFNDVRKNCDNCIRDLIINPYAFFEIYPYVIGNYLADNAIIKLKDDRQLLGFIKYMNDNLYRINPYDVFNILGCGDVDLVNTNEEKQKVKKRNK